MITRIIDNREVEAKDWPTREVIDALPASHRVVGQDKFYKHLNLPPKPLQPCQRCNGRRYWIKMPTDPKIIEKGGILPTTPAEEGAEWQCSFCYDWETGNMWKTDTKTAWKHLKSVRKQRLPRMVYVVVI
jgi:hypothetical protein